MSINDIITVCCICAGVVFLWFVLSLILHHYKKGADKREAKKIEQEREAQRWQNSKIYDDNKLFLAFTSERLIVFAGHQGAGKTLVANLYCKWLVDRFDKRNALNYRFDKFVQPDYLREITNLYKSNLLPVNSNINLVNHETGAHSQDIFPFLYQARRAMRRSIFFLDEISNTFSKDQYLKELKTDDQEAAKLKKVRTIGRFLRQIDARLVGTEQTENNFWKGLRDSGCASVVCQKTIVRLAPAGKFLRKLRHFFNLVLPAVCTCNLRKLWLKQLFKKDRAKLFFKLLLPAYFSLPRDYYQNKMRINESIERRYTIFETLLTYNGIDNWLKFTRADIFDYNTTAYRAQYEKQFDKDGNLKFRGNDVQAS